MGSHTHHHGEVLPVRGQHHTGRVSEPVQVGLSPTLTTYVIQITVETFNRLLWRLLTEFSTPDHVS